MEEEDDDEYISYGTPLPEIEDETVLRKKATRELEVRDEKGRQRFHGAFTGGFSAGYFNTVGTKEGWAPSTFISSRSSVANRVQQAPEDFMDGEDFGEFGIATRRIHTASKFQNSSDLESHKRKYPELDSVIPGEAPLKDIVKPVSESIGIQILNKLGWRVGQGIGPRVKKQQVGSTKVYGCSPFPDCAIIEENDPSAVSFTFAPKDTDAQYFRPKDDVFGLGYTGLSKESVLSARTDKFNPISTKSFLKKDKKKLAITGQAFGVGAFEDDDEDIYSRDDMSQYDFSDLNAKEPSQISNNKEKNKFQLSANEVLDGFCHATQPPPIKKHYPPPDLPRYYRPLHSSKALHPLPKVPTQAEPKFNSRHNLSAGDRSFLLGEKTFQSFQIKSEKKVIEANPDAPKTFTTPAGPSSSHSFRPFPSDQLKQKRYEEYLKLKAVGEVDKLMQPSSMTEWEKQQEIEEFARASMIFKPLSAALSSKFESKSHLSVEHEVMDALAKARQENATKSKKEKKKMVGIQNRKTVEWHPASLLCKRFNVPNPYPNSSEPLSTTLRSKSLFDHISFQTKEAEKHNEPSFPSSEISFDTRAYKNVVESVTVPVTISAVPRKGMKETIPDLSENERPPIDFFKDIFENSSSEEDADTQTKAPSAPSPDPGSKSPTNSDTAKKDFTDTSSKPKPKSNIKKPGFGVFANLDLDALLERNPAKKISRQESIESEDMNISTTKEINDTAEKIYSAEKTDPAKKTDSAEKIESVEKIISAENVDSTEKIDSASVNNFALSNDLYGPNLPPNYSELSSSSRSPKAAHKKHAKHKLKQKHKHHKHKGKKKKKRKSSHKSSEDSSFDSDEDIPPAIIIKKLKKLQNVLKSDM